MIWLRSHSLRLRLLLAVIAVVAAALAVMMLGFNLVLWRQLSSNADALARSRAAVEVGLLDVADGHVVPDLVSDLGGLDSEEWLFVGGRELDGPTVSPALDEAARRAVATPKTIIEVPNESARLFALPAVAGGRQMAVVVVGVSMKAYRTTRKIALIASLVLAGFLLVVVALASRWVLAAALRPVAQMTADADAWSMRDADRRFEVGEPHDELGELATTLNGLLDRLAASLRREQRFSAELSHELRTPLAKICTASELALRHERQPREYKDVLSSVLTNAHTMTSTIDTLVSAQRHQTGLARGCADARTVLDKAAATCSWLAVDRRLELAATAPQSAVSIGVEGDVALRILQPLVENACQYAVARVELSVERQGSEVVFTVDDDGPGVLSSERELIFEPGARGSLGDSGRAFPGAGLGLALSRRLARAASGDVVAPANGVGGHFVVRLPGVE